MNSNTKSKRWFITLNNPSNFGVSHESMMNMLEGLKCLYYCLSDEIGASGTFHYHAFVIFSDDVSYTKLKKILPYAHYEVVNAMNIDVRNYVFKEGKKWRNSAKAETNIRDSHVEFGVMPFEAMKEYLQHIYQLLQYGVSANDILSGRYFSDKLYEPAEEEQTEEVQKYTREIHNFFVEAPGQIGKVRDYLINEYGEENVFFARPTGYEFSRYNGEDVVVFDRLNWPFQARWISMYLDIETVVFSKSKRVIPAYTKVFIISSESFIHSYMSECKQIIKMYRQPFHNPDDFYCQIHTVMSFLDNGEVEKLSAGEYLEKINASDYEPEYEPNYAPDYELEKSFDYDSHYE